MQQITVPKTKVKENIRKFVYQIRKKASLDKQLYFPIVEYMENALGTIDNDFTLDVCPDNELPGILAEACPELHTIKVRQTVYDGACLGHYWHRMTLDFVQCIYDFFKLFSLYLNTITVHDNPASVNIFFS